MSTRLMEMINNINKFLENSLQLEEPWEITHAEFNEKEGMAYITVDVRNGAYGGTLIFASFRAIYIVSVLGYFARIAE